MTIPAQPIVNSYIGDGVSTSFPYTVVIQYETDIQVWVDDVRVTTGITIDNNTSTVTFNVAPAAGARVDIWRWLDIDQTTNYEDRDPFPAETHEGALDRRAMTDQQLAARVDASMSYDPRTTVDPVWDAEGNPIRNVGDPVQSTDALSLKFYQDNGGGIGQDGPAGPGGPPGYGHSVQTIAEMKAIAAPLNQELADVSSAGDGGQFDFDSSLVGEIQGIQYLPNDGTPGAWFRRFQGQVFARWFGAVAGGDPSANRAAIQAALDYLCVSTGPQVEGTLFFEVGVYDIDGPVEWDRRGINWVGQGKRNTEIRATQDMQYMVRHRRDSGLSNQVKFEDIRLNGDGFKIDRALWLESINYGSMSRFEIRNVDGTGAYFAYFQDWPCHIDIRSCGREETIGPTGSMTAGSRDLILSTVDPDLLAGDVIIVPGAGPGGSDLFSTITGGVETTTVTLAFKAETTVSGVILSRHLPGINVNSARWDGLTDRGSTQNISNSMVFQDYSTFERNFATSVFLYQADAVGFDFCKFHARLTTDDPTPKALSLIETDRVKRCRIVGAQVVRPTRRFFVQRSSSDAPDVGTVEFAACEVKDPANYEDASDVAVFEIQAGTADFAAVLVDDELNDASYTTNGKDVYATGTGGVAGDITSRGSPGAGYQVNEADNNSCVTVNRPNRPSHENGPYTAELLFGGTAPDATFTLTANYTKQGKQMTVELVLDFAIIGTDTGNVTIGGLPYVASNEPGRDIMQYGIGVPGVRAQTNPGSAVIAFIKDDGTPWHSSDLQADQPEIYYISFTYLVRD